MIVQEPVSIKDLQGVDLFAELSNYELEQIAKVSSQRAYQAEELCAVQGKTIDELLIVNEGEVAVEVRLEIVPYNQTLRIATLTAGNVFAYCSVVEPFILFASGRCIKASRIVNIKAAELRRIFKERPSIEIIVMRNMAKILCFRLTDITSRLKRLVVQMLHEGM